MARFSVLYTNTAIILLLGINPVEALVTTIPPFVAPNPYAVLTGDTLIVNSSLTTSALTLQPNTLLQISSGATMAYGASPAITTTGGGGSVEIVLEPQSILNTTVFDAISILATDDSQIDIQGEMTGNILFTNPGVNATSIYGGGSVTGNITGFTGVLNLDGTQPVVGTVTGAVGSSAILNLGFKSSIDFTLNHPLTNVPNIFVKNGKFTVKQNIGNLNSWFNNYEQGIVELDAALDGTGIIDNYGSYTIGAAGNITNITKFTNHKGSSATIGAANSLNLNTVINDGLMNVNAAINPVDFTNGANADAQAFLNANFTVTNPLVNGNGQTNSKIVVAHNVNLTTPSLTNSANSTLEFVDKATITSAATVNDGNLVINISSATNFATLLTFTGSLDLHNGTLTVISTLPAPTTPVTLADAITATSITLPKTITSNANIFGTFTASLDTTATNLSLTFTRIPFDKILPNDPNTLTTALENMALATTPTAEQTEILNLVQQNSTTENAYKENLTKLMPLAVNKSVHQLHRSGMKAVLIRVAELSNQNRGYSAGDIRLDMENNLWFRPFYSRIKQSENINRGLLGYRNYVYGMSLGVDTRTLFTKQLVGLAINISKSFIVDQNKSTANTMNHQGMVYGKYNFNSGIYLDWLGSIGVSESNQKRIALDNNPALSKAKWIQYSIRTALGYQMFADYLFTVEPDISLQYTFLNNNDYTETGPSVTNLNVQPKNKSYLVSGVGIRTYLNLDKFNYNFSSSIFARADYTLVGKDVETLASFVNAASPSFTTRVSPQRIMYAVGASTCYSFGNVKVELVFNYDFTKNYRDQQYYLNIAYKF